MNNNTYNGARRWCALLLLFLPLVAKGGLRYLGYAPTDSITLSGVMFGDMGTYSVGATLSKEALSGYKGCRVVGLRMAAAEDLGRQRVFVYEVGDTLRPVVEQRQRLYKGWNTVLFNGDGYTITAAADLFFGFDYTESEQMVTAESGGLCTVGEPVAGAFQAYGDFGSGLGLYDLSGAGRLCVQLIVDVSTLPAKALAVKSLDAGFKYKRAGDKVETMLGAINAGQDTLIAPVLDYRVDGTTVLHVETTDTIAPGDEATWIHTFNLPADLNIGMHELTLASPVLADGYTLYPPFATYERTLPRQKPYLEVYTDQASYLSDLLAKATRGVSERAIVVNVHRPASALALPEADYLSALYAYTYPAFTVNRSYFPGEAHIAYDMNDYLPVFPQDMIEGILTDIIAQDAATPSFASVALAVHLDPLTHELTATAEGRTLPEADAIYGRLALTLMLVEDSVEAPQQVKNAVSGRLTTQTAYNHMGVLRAFLTEPTGDVLTPESEVYTLTRSLSIPTEWNESHLRVVALLTKAGSPERETAALFDVVNAEAAAVGSGDGIEAAQESRVRNQSPSVFDLAGRRVAKVRRGVYIVGGHKVVR